MRHRILTCKNHPELRWSTKDCAWSDGYNGTRSLFFVGIPDGAGMYADGSGLSCTTVTLTGAIVRECACPSTALVLAPEDALVTR